MQDSEKFANEGFFYEILGLRGKNCFLEIFSSEIVQLSRIWILLKYFQGLYHNMTLAKTGPLENEISSQ